MASPASLSVKDISAAAKSSVDKAIVKHKAAFPTPNYTIGYVPPYWWLGIVLENADNKVTLAQAQALATDVHSGLTSSVAAARGADAGIIFVGGHIICGYYPEPPISVLQE